MIMPKLNCIRPRGQYTSALQIPLCRILHSLQFWIVWNTVG